MNDKFTFVQQLECQSGVVGGCYCLPEHGKDPGTMPMPGEVSGEEAQLT